MSLAPRSMLFVSGETPARFAKATDAGADLVCLDLEDAVHPERKTAARHDVAEFLAAQASSKNSCPLAVRINALDTPAGLHDIEALVTANRQPVAVLLPKVEHARDIALVRSWFGQRCPRLVALIESPLGIEAMPTIAAEHRQTPELLALLLGGADLCLELGAEFEWHSLQVARFQLINAAKSYGLQAWDVPHIDLNNLDELKNETVALRRMGFDCKTAIHPKQVPVIHDAWKTDDQAVNRAYALLDLYEARVKKQHQDLGAFLYEGRLVDEPILSRARQLVAQNPRPAAQTNTTDSALLKTPT